MTGKTHGSIRLTIRSTPSHSPMQGGVHRKRRAGLLSSALLAASLACGCTIVGTADTNPAGRGWGATQTGRDNGSSAPEVASTTYTDSQGTTITFQEGDRAFADEVVANEPGNPWTSLAAHQNPQQTLGPPNYERTGNETTYTLGCGGSLTVAFRDNVIRDAPGADLHIFEVGPQVEAFSVAISEDGETWLEVGVVRGQPASVDIAAVATSGAIYRYVRLVDQRSYCPGEWPGADIDAIGTLAPGAP